MKYLIFLSMVFFLSPIYGNQVKPPSGSEKDLENIKEQLIGEWRVTNIYCENGEELPEEKLIALKEDLEEMKKAQPSFTFYEQQGEDLLDVSFNLNFSDIFWDPIIFEDSLCRINGILNYSTPYGESIKAGFLDAEVDGCGMLPKILLEGLKVIKFLKGHVSLEDEAYFQLHDNRLRLFTYHDTTEEGNTDDDHPCVGTHSVLESVRQ